VTLDETDNEKSGISRRELLQRGLIGTAGVMGLSALTLADVENAFARFLEAGKYPKSLVTAAKKDGHLNVIALPRDWANYGQIMDTYNGRWNISITDSVPLGSSAQEIQAITSLKGQSRGPDVVDVSPAKALQGVQEKLFQPYKVATWSTIPKSAKHAKGLWYGDYYGVTSFLSVSQFVKNPPKDWPDLLKPEYKGQVSLGGDPRSSGEAFGAVFGAALANGGSLNNILPGVDFFAKIKTAGNWNPTLGNAIANDAKGATPIVIRWDYLTLADRDSLAKQGMKATVTVPKVVFPNYYCQAISKYAPHTHAAKLWMEFLYSDEGQTLFLKGYAHPIRYADLAKRGKIPASIAKKLPSASHYKNLKFASAAQLDKAQTILNNEWGSKMGVS
jgi:putative spermidine/putrescine transport system substrate-binding protein